MNRALGPQPPNPSLPAPAHKKCPAPLTAAPGERTAQVYSTLPTTTVEASPLFHPAADIFPPMSDAEYSALKADIEQHGQKEPVVYWRGQLIDGRHRHRACEELGIQCSECELDDDDDPVSYVVSLNLHRRHLDESQRAMVAARIANLKRGEKKADSSIALSSVSQADAAALLNVSPASVKRAKTVIESGTPELIAAVDAGEVAVSKAAQIVKPTPAPVEVEPDDADFGILPPQEFEGRASKAHVSHNSGDNEWYTPEQYVDAAREVMGGIDLDPASSEIANTVVDAGRIHTADEDGLLEDWNGRVWLNPPYAQPLIMKFCEKLLGHLAAGDVTEAVVLVNNATETKWFQALLAAASAVCFPSGRVRFWHPDKSQATPLQGQAVLYFGPSVEKFVDQFGEHGIAAPWGARELEAAT